MTPLHAALTWRALGVATIPIRYRDKRPLVAWNEYRDRLPSTRELYGWFHGRHVNLGLVCGWQGLTVIDFDDADIYGAWRAWALASSGIAALVAELSYQVRTWRGVHVYAALDDPPPGTIKLPRIDVKAAGGYVLAPPSTHPSGTVYHAVHDGAPIVRADNLEEILPAALFPEPEEPELPAVNVRRVHGALSSDPWQAAFSPTLMVGDEPGLVESAAQRLRLVDMLPRPLHRHGRYYICRCPLHNDVNTPNMTYDPQKDKVKCWAGCTGGHWFDAIDLYAALSGLELGEAIKVLAS